MSSMVPWSFIRERTSLSCSETVLGYHKQWLGWKDVVAWAADRISHGTDDDLTTELAGLTKVEAHRVGELLTQLDQVSAATDNAECKSKWLYLHLAWLYENRDTTDDPLQAVECIYADFDYPEDVAPFVRYMPATDGYDPSAHSAAESQNRLIAKWRSYLDRKAGSAPFTNGQGTSDNSVS